MAFRAAEYERYKGQRTNRPAWFPIAFGTIKRGWQSKWVRRLTMLSLMMGFGLMVMMYMINQVVPQWREITDQAAEMASNGGGKALSSNSGMYLVLTYVFVRPILLPLALLFGYDLIASDMRTNALEAYFSRPVTPLGYLTGRTLAFVCFLMIATFGPFFIVWLADVATSPSEEHTQLIRTVPIGLFFSLAIISTTVALMVQAITSLTRSAIWSNLVFVVIFLFLSAMGGVLWAITDEPNMWAFSFAHDAKVVCATLLGVDLRASGNMDSASPVVAFSVMIGISVTSFFIVLRGLRRRSLVS
jgi:ABC-type transport system involved in multi-copper enzyme maturation permease subunit